MTIMILSQTHTDIHSPTHKYAWACAHVHAHMHTK